MRIPSWSIVPGLCALLAAQAPSPPPARLDTAGARAVLAEALAECKRLNAPGGAIAVVDAGGHLLAFERLDSTFAKAAEVSIGKARTAALFQKPTRVFENAINQGRTAMAALADITPLQGGVPILIGGQFVGAVGVSGAASAQQDDDIATKAAALSLPIGACCTGMEPTPVTHLPAKDVQAAFAVGKPLLEVPGYKVHASRRERPGDAEVHTDETDVIYVLAGKATFVTGGAVVDGKTVAPHELRGARIDGGQVRQLVPGDVVVVPAGTPHWFQQVDAPFSYYVVKVVHGQAHG
ncbi:MAG: heme-binding protein [Planctomycetes bacterium]|nr:heme-binding protein [Planctomycetota bacterium]